LVRGAVPHDYAGLGRTSGRLSETLGPGNPEGYRQGLGGNRQGPSRKRIRKIPHCAGPLVRERIQSLITNRGWGFWAVEIKYSQEFIGFVGLHVPTTILTFSPCVEVGWRLDSGHWGKGYATEAATEAIQFGFDKLGLVEIVSFTTLKNYRSQNVMKKLGMKKTTKTFEHPDIPMGHTLREHCLYKLSRDQWQTGRISK
jgi:RimJ/RimL family protein N-acetyltransferase